MKWGALGMKPEMQTQGGPGPRVRGPGCRWDAGGWGRQDWTGWRRWGVKGPGLQAPRGSGGGRGQASVRGAGSASDTELGMSV